MGKRRPVVVSNPPSKKELEKVFAAAPFTKLSSSVDLFILAIECSNILFLESLLINKSFSLIPLFSRYLNFIGN
jgi:hypothetical protein